MALTVSQVAAANSIVSTPTLDLAIAAVPVAVGDWLELAVTADNAGAAGIASLSATVTDTAGNTWVNRSLTNNTPGGVVNDGTTLGIWTCLVTTAMVTGTVTVNFSPDTTAKAAEIKKAVPDAGQQILLVSVGAGFIGTGTTFSTGNFSVTSGDTVLAWASHESSSVIVDDADTTNGTWTSGSGATANVGTSATSQRLWGQSKTVTATGDQSYDVTTSVARDWAANYLILRSFTPTFARTTQVAIESLSNATPKLRATQQAVEALSISNPAERVTQVVVEVLTTTEVLPLAALVSQQVIEVLSDNPAVSTGLAAGVATVMGAGQQAVEGVGLAEGVATVTGAGQSTFTYGNRLNIISS